MVQSAGAVNDLLGLKGEYFYEAPPTQGPATGPPHGQEGASPIRAMHPQQPPQVPSVFSGAMGSGMSAGGVAPSSSHGESGGMSQLDSQRQFAEELKRMEEKKKMLETEMREFEEKKNHYEMVKNAEQHRMHLQEKRMREEQAQLSQMKNLLDHQQERIQRQKEQSF